MNRSEKTLAVATVGFAIAAVGTFLPWSRIGGRSRSGYDTADTFISLAAGALPDAVAWIGRWWYAPAFLVVLLWALAFVESRRATRIAAAAMGALALGMWWFFIWVGSYYSVLNVEPLGPMVSTAGVLLLLAAAVPQGTSAFARGSSSAQGT